MPIYSLESWLGLRFNDACIYLDVLREVYEALVIYSFYQFLVFYLGGEDYLGVVMARKEPTHHLLGFQHCVNTWQMGPRFLHNTKVGALQYVVVKPLLAIITFVTQATGKYNEGSFGPAHAYPYITFFTNISQLWAMYCLGLLYLATAKELAPIQPIPKFLSVKAIVFFTWWQGVLISILVSIGVIPTVAEYSPESVGKGIQEFIVCIEMLGFAIGHVYAFPAKEFHDPERHVDGGPMFHSLLQITNPLDIMRDVRNVVKHSEMLDNRPRDRNGNPISELITPVTAPNASGPFLLSSARGSLLESDSLMQHSDKASLSDGI